jgi:hypothetical protein
VLASCLLLVGGIFGSHALGNNHRNLLSGTPLDRNLGETGKILSHIKHDC